MYVGKDRTSPFSAHHSTVIYNKRPGMAPIHAPTPNPAWPLPNFGLIIADLSHPGVEVFLGAVNAREALEIATRASYTWLHNEQHPPAL